jgi:hypothetical protein
MGSCTDVELNQYFCKYTTPLSQIVVTFTLCSQETSSVGNRIRKIEKRRFLDDSIHEVVLVEKSMSMQNTAKEKEVKYPTLSQYIQKIKLSL